MKRTQLYRDRLHDHYWIDDGELFESYHTLRGMRYRFLLDVNGMPDCDNCPEEMIAEIEEKYLQNNPTSIPQ